MTKCLNIQLTAEHFGFFTNFFFHYFIYLKVFKKKKRRKQEVYSHMPLFWAISKYMLSD